MGEWMVGIGYANGYGGVESLRDIHTERGSGPCAQMQAFYVGTATGSLSEYPAFG